MNPDGVQLGQRIFCEVSAGRPPYKHNAVGDPIDRAVFPCDSPVPAAAPDEMIDAEIVEIEADGCDLLAAMQAQPILPDEPEDGSDERTAPDLGPLAPARTSPPNASLALMTLEDAVAAQRALPRGRS